MNERKSGDHRREWSRDNKTFITKKKTFNARRRRGKAYRSRGKVDNLDWKGEPRKRLVFKKNFRTLPSGKKRGLPRREAR